MGLAELSGFNHYRITGTNALKWISSLTCSKVSTKIGKASLCYFLTPKGNIAGEGMVAPLPNGEVFYGSAATAEYHDLDWLTERLPKGSDIRIESRTNSHTMLVLAGPNSRDLLAAVSRRTRWGQSEFPWLTAQRVFIGHIEALVIAISYSGEQAFELHIPNSQIQAAYDILIEKGAKFNLSHFGMHAIESMRLEKGFGHWKTDFITDFNPFEAGLHRFVDMNKDFPGKSGLQAQFNLGNRKERVILEVQSGSHPAHPGEGVFADGLSIGSITSGAWGFRTGKNLAMAYIEPGYANQGSEVAVLLGGEPTRATVCPPCMFDPDNELPRGIRRTS